MADRLLHPGWSWTVGRDWLLPVAGAVVTLFLGAAVGGLPTVLAGSWTDPQTRIATWTSLALAAVGLLALAATGLIWRGRNGIRRRHGTAYIIQETARGWTAEDHRVFLASVKRQFARRIDVPGPGKLSGSWDWPLDKEAQGWDEKVTELVRAFQALRSDDDPATPKGLFMWAWAPVAMAFGIRVTVAERGLSLDVWQRPSTGGRAGDVKIPSWSQGPHRFGAQQQVPALTDALRGSRPTEHQWPAEVTIKSLVPAVGLPEAAASEASAPVILLVRFGRQSWGPVPDVPTEPAACAPLTLVLQDAIGLSLPGTFRAEIQEFRMVPPAGGRLFPWAAYPALVNEATAWIRKRTAATPGSVTLLATVLPPEVAVGLGINVCQPTGSAWATHLWPIVPKPSADEFVLPRLNLGTAALPGVAVK